MFLVASQQVRVHFIMCVLVLSIESKFVPTCGTGSIAIYDRCTIIIVCFMTNFVANMSNLCFACELFPSLVQILKGLNHFVP